MRGIKYVLLAAFVFLFLSAAPKAQAQISVGINLGPAPYCPYGYFDYAPYQCAPYGYYGPEWFHGGIFWGAGPWFRGPAGFHGYVNRSFDPRYGYHGGFPAHGAYREPADHFHSFHGSEARDGHGHAVGGGHPVGGGGHPAGGGHPVAHAAPGGGRPAGGGGHPVAHAPAGGGHPTGGGGRPAPGGRDDHR